MRSVFLRLTILVIFLMLVLPASADQGRDNPSVYSFAEIVQKLPGMWDTDPLSVMDLMNNYPDFVCYKSHDIIGCTSVNNKYSSEIHVNYQFTTAEDDAKFVRATFSMAINSSEEIQKMIEAFWIDGMTAANISGAYYPPDQIILYFKTNENVGQTLMTVTVPMAEDGSLWLIMMDFGVVRG